MRSARVSPVTGERFVAKYNDEVSVSVKVFKTIVDPFIGKYSLFYKFFILTNRKMERRDLPPKSGLQLQHQFPVACMVVIHNDEVSVSVKVFKTIVDPFIGKYSLFKVCTGVLKADSSSYNVNKDTEERIGKVYTLRGKEQIEYKVRSVCSPCR